VHAKRITANLRVADVDEAKSFYRDFLGLSTEDFNMGWVARYRSPDTSAEVQLVTRDATAGEDSVISVHTDDVDAAYEEARKLGLEIVHPLTTEAWGVRRFLVRAPDGNVVNVVRHRESAAYARLTSPSSIRFMVNANRSSGVPDVSSAAWRLVCGKVSGSAANLWSSSLRLTAHPSWSTRLSTREVSRQNALT